MNTKIKPVYAIFIVALVGSMCTHIILARATAIAHTLTFEETAQISTKEKNKKPKDLLSFSIQPHQKITGVIVLQGEIQGGYFFEGNILLNIVDVDKNIVFKSYLTAQTDWMTTGPVLFGGALDTTKLPKGPAYIELRQDDPSGGESGRPIKYIQIPVVIE